MSLIEKIDSPSDLKRLSIDELPQLAKEIRQRIIDVISTSGGHLASSLGAVELAIVVHYIFDAPRDMIVWDIGHQAYAHKLLTGRRDLFHTIRQMNGLSGFPNKDESPYDLFTTGHGSTSVSMATGLAASRDIKGGSEAVVAIIGDAALGGGMAFEALNHIGHTKKDMLVILNDNKMSISPSVGALSRYLNKILTAPAYNIIRKDIEVLLQRIPRFGFRAIRAAKRLEDSLKNLLVPGMLFEEMGFRYFGPIDGHNIVQLVNILKSVKNMKGPVFIHVVTKKGKGYSAAEKIPEKFHGVGAFDIETGEKKSAPGQVTFTDTFSQKLIALARINHKIVGISAAMPEGTGLNKFAIEFPDRFFDVGMAEQHAVSFASGVAKGGFKPVVAIYSTFLQRAYDQIIHDICLQNLNVVFAIDRAGLVGEDGPTHHGIFDIAYLRAIPNLVMMAPKDTDEFEMMLEFAMYHDGPISIRYPRGGIPTQGLPPTSTLNPQPPVIQLGFPEILREGSDLAILALGTMCYPALEAAELLLKENDVYVCVVNARFVKPIYHKFVLNLVKKYRLLFTVEEGVLDGGFGSAILEILERYNVDGIQLKRIGLKDIFYEHGKREELFERYGLTAKGIVTTIRETLYAKDYH